MISAPPPRPFPWLLQLVAFVGLLLATGCGPRGPVPQRKPVPTTSQEEVGDGLLLDSSELGPRWREDAVPVGVPPWPWVQDECPAYRPDEYPAQKHRQKSYQRLYRLDDQPAAAHHVVEKYEKGWAQRALDEIRQVLMKCASYSLPVGRISFRVVDPAFQRGAGLLVRGQIVHTDSSTTTAYYLTVRRGDIISTLRLPDVSAAAMIVLGQKQVDRLG
jgi:hypothetical protein